MRILFISGKGQLTIYGQTEGTGTFNSQRTLYGGMT